jgi:hypothetical protein
VIVPRREVFADWAEARMLKVRIKLINRGTTREAERMKAPSPTRALYSQIVFAQENRDE